MLCVIRKDFSLSLSLRSQTFLCSPFFCVLFPRRVAFVGVTVENRLTVGWSHYSAIQQRRVRPSAWARAFKAGGSCKTMMSGCEAQVSLCFGATDPCCPAKSIVATSPTSTRRVTPSVVVGCDAAYSRCSLVTMARPEVSIRRPECCSGSPVMLRCKPPSDGAFSQYQWKGQRERITHPVTLRSAWYGFRCESPSSSSPPRRVTLISKLR